MPKDPRELRRITDLIAKVLFFLWSCWGHGGGLLGVSLVAIYTASGPGADQGGCPQSPRRC